MSNVPDDAAATRETIRAHYGEPSDMVKAKQLRRLDGHARAFIRLSPFLVIASADADGRADATPRGDAPGFVTVLDDATLLIPDRIGNRRADTMLNVTANPAVGLLFLVPGINETLRVNGRGRFTAEEALLAPSAVQGRNPVAGLLVAIEEVFFHCAKAMMRSRLWDADTQVERSTFPSLGQILTDQIAGSDLAESERYIADSYRHRLY